MTSFLNAVLNSLDDGTVSITPPVVRPTSRTDVHPRRNSPVPTVEQKSESSTGKMVAKSIKGDHNPASTGAATSSSASTLQPARVRDVSRPLLDVTPSTEKKAAPKKGSYAEIMARAKQNSIAPVGIITHKPKDKLSSKKEIALRKDLALGKRKRSAGTPIVPVSGSKNSDPGPDKQVGGGRSAAKPEKAVAYQGTMMPKPKLKPKLETAYKGTMKQLNSTSATARGNGYSSEPDPTRITSSEPKRRKSYDDGDSGEDDGYSYASEDFSDMDAGFEDVEAEDEKASRLAKKEDNYEQMMLQELKRQKEAKRRRLEAMAERTKGRKT